MASGKISVDNWVYPCTILLLLLLPVLLYWKIKKMYSFEMM